MSDTEKFFSKVVFLKNLALVVLERGGSTIGMFAEFLPNGEEQGERCLMNFVVKVTVSNIPD